MQVALKAKLKQCVLRDEVRFGGLKVHSKKVHRFPRSHEGDARASEHHDTETDQQHRKHDSCIHSGS